MQTVYLLTLPAALERFGDLFTAETRRLALRFGFRIAAHFAALSAGPKTVVHGDFRADNMLFGKEGQEDGLAVIDWQCFGLRCGMYDVCLFPRNQRHQRRPPLHRARRSGRVSRHSMSLGRGELHGRGLLAQLPAEYARHADAHGHRPRCTGHERS